MRLPPILPLLLLLALPAQAQPVATQQAAPPGIAPAPAATAAPAAATAASTAEAPAVPALAEEVSVTPVATAPALAADTPRPIAQAANTRARVAPAADARAPADPARTAPKQRGLAWQQRFAQANATHDGHLTLQQAKDGYRAVARHFKQIDVDKKGYVTIENIDAWHKLQRAMRHPGENQAGQPLRARPAMQHTLPGPGGMTTSNDTRMMPATQPDAGAAPPPNAKTAVVAPRHGT